LLYIAWVCSQILYISRQANSKKMFFCTIATKAAFSFSSSSSGLWQDSTNNSSRDNNEKENNELSYRGLQLLAREQTIRIKLLETQLREERVQHELLVERLQIQVVLLSIHTTIMIYILGTIQMLY
jgi:hypothetical protein